MLTCVYTFVYCKRKHSTFKFFSESRYSRSLHRDHIRLVLSTLDVSIPYAILLSSLACGPLQFNS